MGNSAFVSSNEPAMIRYWLSAFLRISRMPLPWRSHCMAVPKVDWPLVVLLPVVINESMLVSGTTTALASVPSTGGAESDVDRRRAARSEFHSFGVESVGLLGLIARRRVGCEAQRVAVLHVPVDQIVAQPGVAADVGQGGVGTGTRDRGLEERVRAGSSLPLLLLLIEPSQ